MKKGILNLFTKSILTTACFLTAITIISCPTPINEKMFQQVKDTVVPQITVTSPIDGDAYGAYTLVTGVVSDLSDGGADGSVSNLSIEILGVTGNQSISVDDSGNFSTVLTTSGTGYSGDIVLKLTALDWNGNSTETTLALKKVEESIVGLTVTVGNKSTVIHWIDLPGASSYTVQEFLTLQIVEGVTNSSYTWEGLTNGNLYSFMVSAEVDGSMYYSAIKYAMPLSPRTLTPNLESVYRGINLSWKNIPAISEYVVERSEEKEGPYSVRTITTESIFLDSGLVKALPYTDSVLTSRRKGERFGAVVILQAPLEKLLLQATMLMLRPVFPVSRLLTSVRKTEYSYFDHFGTISFTENVWGGTKSLSDRSQVKYSASGASIHFCTIRYGCKNT